MAARMEKTKTPCVFRRGGRYVVVWVHNGRQHKESCRTLAEAREAQGKRRQHGAKRPATRQTFEEYAREWLGTYTGRTKRGRPGALTSADYRRSVDRAVKFFGPRRRLADVEPPDVRAYVRELEGEGMAPSSIRKRLAPLKAMFATAVEDGALPRDPTRPVRVSGRRSDGEVEDARVYAVTREQLARFLAEVPEEWRLFFELLAHGGLRISEQIGLDCGDVLFGERPRLRVERQHCKGETRGLKYESRREVPLSPGMARRLWVHTEGGKAPEGRAPLPERARRETLRVEPPVPRPRQGARARRPPVGDLPHLPAHLRVAAVRGGEGREAGLGVARPRRSRLHPPDLRAPHGRRARRGELS